MVLELTTRHQEATALLQKAEEALRNELATLRQQAAVAAEHGDLATEIAAYQKILELDPNNLKVEAKLKAAQQEIPRRVEEMYRDGVDHYAKRQYQEALKIFETLLKLQPEHAKARDAARNIKEKMIQTGQ
ncbi:MAG: hypothetical protein HGA76_09880 [Candidatus Firestonebacteria bacterium]|nr:hypothetical protein [Candidatus Firestonebacteria bacterium]